jgi:hypothetical protein
MAKELWAKKLKIQAASAETEEVFADCLNRLDKWDISRLSKNDAIVFKIFIVSIQIRREECLWLLSEPATRSNVQRLAVVFHNLANDVADFKRALDKAQECLVRSA